MGVPNSQPARGSYPITPNDSADIPQVSSRGIHCNTAGDFHAIFADGSEDTLTALAGVTYPWQVTRVFEDTTGTYSALL